MMQLAIDSIFNVKISLYFNRIRVRNCASHDIIDFKMSMGALIFSTISIFKKSFFYEDAPVHIGLIRRSYGEISFFRGQ